VVCSRRAMLRGYEFQANVRYCRDRAVCRAVAPVIADAWIADAVGDLGYGAYMAEKTQDDKAAEQRQAQEKAATREERGATPDQKRASDTRHGVDVERK
jgi:hypothetical protein